MTSTFVALLLSCIALTFASVLGAQTAPEVAPVPGRAPHSSNPILPGYYADPSIVELDGMYYLYATIDPWGGDTLGCWESKDLKSWSYRTLNWPTKQACTSPTSMEAKVWAPSVVRGPGGKYHMAVSVGSEVWLGVADHPLGPWKNVRGEKPFVAADWNRTYHMIDAELFVDDDGQPYMYWGSGWNWENGHCFVVKLSRDLSAMVGEPRDVTPPHYFEAPLMVKRNGRYFLMYSAGNTTKDTYQVHYAVGTTPMGPFKEASNSPILVTDAPAGIVSPGHHTVFQYEEKDYILYHRHSLPFNPEVVARQICVDALTFTKDGLIEKVTPTHTGPPIVQRRQGGEPHVLDGVLVTSSSQASANTARDFIVDDNYATRWAADPKANGAWLRLDLGSVKTIQRQAIRPEFTDKDHRFIVQSSDDGKDWKTFADFRQTPLRGSPLVIGFPVTARYLKLAFFDDVPGSDISLIEWECW